MTAIKLASTQRSKPLAFISSTAVIESEHYVKLSDALVNQGHLGVPENDDLEGTRMGIPTGYGQTKWVSEKLIMEAARRGFTGCILRPGYVSGDSISAGKCQCKSISLYSALTTFVVTNTDDFIWRLVKGCIQLGFIPEITNTVNMVPVDHVARCIALAAINPQRRAQVALVYHITSRPTVTYNDLLEPLTKYGYSVQKCDYLIWRQKLEQHVLDSQDNALFPLLHFVLDDLPRSTKSAEIDDTNTRTLLQQENGRLNITVDDGLMGQYLSWLVNVGFLPLPEKVLNPLPELTKFTSNMKAIGRSGRI